MIVVTVKELHDQTFTYDVVIVKDEEPKKEQEMTEEDYQRQVMPRLEER